MSLSTVVLYVTTYLSDIVPFSGTLAVKCELPAPNVSFFLKRDQDQYKCTIIFSTPQVLISCHIHIILYHNLGSGVDTFSHDGVGYAYKS